MIHLKKQVAFFLLARLNHELSRAICCVSIRYACRILSPSFSLSYEVNASSATPAKLHVNINGPAVLTKRFANKCFADEGALILSSKYSSSNLSQVRPNWFFNSSLITSGRCWVAQLRRFLGTPQSSFFRQLSSSFAVSRAIYQTDGAFIAFAFWGLNSSSVPRLVAFSISVNTSAIFRVTELPL